MKIVFFIPIILFMGACVENGSSNASNENTGYNNSHGQYVEPNDVRSDETN